ncbi:hypothetical protein FRC03_007599 [Tulasnella sp. 419]|nr:hypothetical protein FRC02_011368 [Tulasnella sp. 418]KAG8968402.1 hypothetical protein FRC03_007599 [Tulasnella sp. 419]
MITYQVAGKRSATTVISARRGYAAKSAESTLYHLAPKGFWKKFRDAVVVNPEISTGLPLPDVHRYPQPGSRPEKYATPATMASDPAQNPYHKRDVRRAYPQLSVVSQSEMAQLLLASPDVTPSSETSVTTTGAPQDLTSAIATVSSAKKVFSTTSLPPKPPIPFHKWTAEQAPDAPHDPKSYFPMRLFK